MHSGSVSKRRLGKVSCSLSSGGLLAVCRSSPAFVWEYGGAPWRGRVLRLAFGGRRPSTNEAETGCILKMAAMSDEDDLEPQRRAAAAEWVAKLSRTSIDASELQAFFSWRRDPANRRVWDAIEAGGKRVDRFVVRPETERFKVIDIWTGETAIIASTPQQHMSEEDALHMARLLNRSVKDGDRSVRR